MKRLFPAPCLSLALWGLWLLLNLSLSPGNLLLGALLGFIAPVLSAPLRPLPVKVGKPGVMLKLLLLVMLDSVLSNLAVFWRVWTHRRHPPRSAFVKVPLDLRDANGLAVLSMITTLVPGTVWSELAMDRSVLLIHVFDLDDEARFIEHFKRSYERPLMEIFQ
ncbi:MAG: Na+/H+ antiporter subunit E [Pseudomonas sp.]